MTDLRQTPQYAKYMKSLGWSVVGYQTPGYQVFIKKVPLIGNIAKLQRPQKTDFIQIKKFIKKYNISAFYIEPSVQGSYPNTFKTARSAFLPAKTLQLDLTKTEDQLLKSMKPKTRYNIKVAGKRGVQVLESANIDNFIKLWASSARSRLALPQSKEIKSLWEAFGKNARLLMACHEKQLLAGLLIAHSKDTGFYMYAASNKEGKKMFAPTLVTWEAIKLAKSLKLKTFDFEGIYDERYSSTKSWRGFTKFKEGFGGSIVEYPPTLVSYSNKAYELLLNH